MNSQEQTQQVYVVGSQQLQNALLTEFLVKEDVATKSIPSVEGVSVDVLASNKIDLQWPSSGTIASTCVQPWALGSV